jgi:hypothetical protein
MSTEKGEQNAVCTNETVDGNGDPEASRMRGSRGWGRD